MGKNQLLIVINEGPDYIEQPTSKYRNSFYRKKDTKKTALIISLSICISVITIAIVLVLVKFRNKFLNPKRKNYEVSEAHCIQQSNNEPTKVIN